MPRYFLKYPEQEIIEEISKILQNNYKKYLTNPVIYAIMVIVKTIIKNIRKERYADGYDYFN